MTVAGDQLIPNAQCAACLADVHAFTTKSGNTLHADVMPYSEADGEGRCLVVLRGKLESAIYDDVADRFTTYHAHYWGCVRKVEA